MSEVRRNPLEDIVHRDPISVTIDPPKGYEGVRTTIQIRDSRATDPDVDLSIDVVINTEFRDGPRSRTRRATREEVAKHHRELSELVLAALRGQPGLQ